MKRGADAPARPAAPLRESHAHVHQFGRSLGMIDLSACASAEEMLGAIARRAETSDAPILLAQAARPESWTTPDWPTLAEFDRASAGRPALAWCFDYHALQASSAMLALAGISPETPDPPGGLIRRERDGGLTGVVLEAAALRVWNAVPEPARAERVADILAADAALASHGFIEVDDLKSQRWLGPTLAGLAASGRLSCRYTLWPLLIDLADALAGRASWESRSVRLGGAKIFVDGTLNSRTAWMLEPFADGIPEHPRGTPMMTAAEIEDAVRRCDEAGVPLAAHAIGDGAVRAVLDAIERVRPRTPGFRIEHAEVIDAADVPRFATLGVIASVQPCHLLYDIEALRRALPDRLARVLPLRDLIDAGCVPGESLIFGSDVPIVRPNPEDSVLASTARRRGATDGSDAIGPEQAISEAEAWRCFGAASG